jgi:hypothetical protein
MRYAATVLIAALILGLSAGWVLAAGATKPADNASSPADTSKKPGDKTGPASKTGQADKTGPADTTGPSDRTGPDETKTGPVTPPPTEDQQKAAEIATMLQAGNADQALEAAKAFLAKTRDEKAKTEAMRVVAECYRKKGDWKQAMPAYLKLRERYEKASDEYVRYDAIAEILRSSPGGVYQPPGATTTAAAADVTAPAVGKTVSDDEVLAQALNRLAGFRNTRLKSRVAMVRRARTPQEVMSAFAPAAEEARQIFLLGPNVSPEAARELATVAGARLNELGKQVENACNAKFQRYKPKFDNPWSFSNLEEKDVANTSAQCKELAQCEKNFQESLFSVAGKGDWPEGDNLRKDSMDRRGVYDQLAGEFVVPEHKSVWW